MLNLREIYFTLNTKLQSLADSILLKKAKFYKYSAILIADVESGRIIVMSCYNEDKFDYDVCLNEKFPSASLFKIVTAIASIEILNLNPDDIVHFSGRIYSEVANTWLTFYPNRYQLFKHAFAFSNNPAFGRLSMLIGRENLYKYGKRLLFDVQYPTDDTSLALMGAGFINAYIKPIDALRLVIAIANKGFLKSITLIDSIPNFYYYRTQIERKIMEEETFYKLKELFRETVISGTASKFLKDQDVGGKTGSLYDKNHNGHIEWFAGFFPVDNPKFAFVSMSVERRYYKKLSPILNIKPFIEFFENYALKF